MQQPATQPPILQPPYQPQMGQIPQNQVPNVQQSPVGQQHAKIPMFQSAIQPQPPYQQNQGQPSLMRVQTHVPQPMFPQMPAQPNLLNRQATFQQQSYQPPPQMQYSMMQPQIYGPHPGIYPPQYSQPPLPYQMPPQQGVNMMHPGIPIVSHKRGDALQPGSWIPVNEPVVQVGLGWDFTGGETFDLDASITGFDEKYNVIESIYFNNKRGLNNSVIHFGDNVTGEGEGDDEVIKVVLNKVPNRVRFLAVTINSYKNNSLIRAKSAYIRIYTSSYHIGKYVLNRTKDCIGLLLGVFERDPIQNIWYFRVMADPIRGNKVTLSYEDIKTLLGSYSMANADSPSRINHPLPGEPLFEFNKWIRLQNRFTYVGLGWHIQSGQNYDLDASIMTFDKMNNLMEIIYHENLQSYNKSIIHYGDNRTGLGEGDDEVLSIDFAKVDPNTFTMAVVINSFKGNSMNFVLNAFVRLYDTQKPIGVHILNNCPECVGLCMGLLRKDTDGVWYFCAIKDIVSGIVCTQSVNDVKYLLDKYPLKI
jgi:stress response protein SCP2